MPTTNISYVSPIPPKMLVSIVYKVVPEFAGGGGGGTPVTPVPVGVVLQGGTVGLSYSETISAQGGSGTGYVYALLSGGLPTGTSLNTATGVISGTTSAAATYSFTIGVTDSLGNTGSQSFSITVSAAAAGGGAFTFLN